MDREPGDKAIKVNSLFLHHNISNNLSNHNQVFFYKLVMGL